MKASKIFNSLEALPQVHYEWQTDQDQREQTRHESPDRAEVLHAAPDERLLPFTPREWGINE